MSELGRKSAALEGATRRARSELSDLDQALKIVADRLKDRAAKEDSAATTHAPRRAAKA